MNFETNVKATTKIVTIKLANCNKRPMGLVNVLVVLNHWSYVTILELKAIMRQLHRMTLNDIKN